MTSVRRRIMDSIGKLLGTREARVASCVYPVLINLPRAFKTRPSQAKHEPVVNWNTMYGYESQTNSE